MPARPQLATAAHGGRLRQRLSISYAYDVYFSRGILELDNPVLADVLAAEGAGPAAVLAVLDAGMEDHHRQLEASLERYQRRWPGQLQLAGIVRVPGGEAAKNDPEVLANLYAAFSRAGLCRHSYVLAIGGGAVLDVTGFAAATAHRGLRLIRVPTTVLAQNDSGVGVKNAINAAFGKNFIGTFAPPVAVINDSEFLATLSDRDWRSGIAEAVKVALIRDAELFDFIETAAPALAAREAGPMDRLIHWCARLHLQQIATGGDPFERGSGRPLDFGHWAAHRLEQLTDHRLRHGEAVAIGIALDTVYSHLCLGLQERSCRRVLGALATLGFRLWVPALSAHRDDPEHPRSIFRGLEAFRQHLGGELTLTLIPRLGKGRDVHRVDFTGYRRAIEILAAWEGASP